MRLAQARAGVEALEEDLAKARYLQLAGLQAEVDTGPLYAKHAGLFAKPLVLEALAAARALGAAPGASPGAAPGHAPRFLAAYLAHGLLDEKVQPLTDRAETLEATLQVPVMGQPIPYRLLAVRIANEAHRERRGDLARVQARATEQHLNPVLRERWAALHGLVQDLGFPDYARFCGALAGVDYAALRDGLDTLVRRTDTLYRWHMEGLLGRGAAVLLALAEVHDVAHSLRAPWFDDQFAPGMGLPALDAVLGPLGLRLGDHPQIRADLEPRPTKSPRAFVVPVRVPGDVRLVVQPKGGHDDVRALFHEAGHALHFGLTDEALPMELRRLGDPAVTEAYAFLLEHILAEEAWASQVVAPHLLERYLWQQRVLRLYQVRRHAAKLRYELDLHAKGLEGAAEAYKKHLDRVLVFSHPREAYLTDLDDAFYAATYLRAWALEALLRKHAVERFGAAWWQKPEAGDWLRGLWAQGLSRTAEDLAREVAGGPLTVQPLQEELIGLLKQEPEDFTALPKW